MSLHFGNKLKEYRTINNFSQSNIANKLGTVKSTISKWENNLLEPDIETIKKIADIFDISTDELLDHDCFIKTVNPISDFNTKEKELLNLFNQLQFEEQSHIIGYIKGIIREKNRIKGIKNNF